MRSRSFLIWVVTILSLSTSAQAITTSPEPTLSKDSLVLFSTWFEYSNSFNVWMSTSNIGGTEQAEMANGRNCRLIKEMGNTRFGLADTHCNNDTRYVHIDFMPTAACDMDIYIIGGNWTTSSKVTKALNANEWNSIDIKASDFGLAADKVEGKDVYLCFANHSTEDKVDVYMDNAYWYTVSDSSGEQEEGDVIPDIDVPPTDSPAPVEYKDAVVMLSSHLSSHNYESQWSTANSDNTLLVTLPGGEQCRKFQGLKTWTRCMNVDDDATYLTDPNRCVHIDIYPTEDCEMEFYLINYIPYWSEASHQSRMLKGGQWNSIDLRFSDFNLNAKTSYVGSFFLGNLGDKKINIFIDNVYYFTGTSETGKIEYGEIPSYNTNPIAADATGMSKTPAEIAKEMFCGWNLGNTLEFKGEETWAGSPVVTQELIDYVKSLGFKAIRIPCCWDRHRLTNKDLAKIHETWLKRVKEIVQYCVNDDLYVILNMHEDGGWIQKYGFTDLSEENVSFLASKLKAYWEQIATYLRDFDEHLLFAGMNEPGLHAIETSATPAQMQAYQQALLRYHQAFVDAVRSTGGRNAYRTLVVQCLGTWIDNAVDYFKEFPTDETGGNRLMLEAHFYSPSEFCDKTGSEAWYYWAKENLPSTADIHYNRFTPVSQAKSLVNKQMKKLYDTFVAKGTPVIMGEWGAYWRNLSGESGQVQAKHDASIHDFYQCVNSTCIQYDIVPFVWDVPIQNASATETFNIVDRKNLSIYGTYAYQGILDSINQATAIAELSATAPSVNDCWFTLTGIKIAKPTAKGVYVHGGSVAIIP